jgi:hypothetical protein
LPSQAPRLGTVSRSWKTEQCIQRALNRIELRVECRKEWGEFADLIVVSRLFEFRAQIAERERADDTRRRFELMRERADLGGLFLAASGLQLGCCA